MVGNGIYLDTNVFIDLLDSTRPHAKKSIRFFREAISGEKELYVNSDTITTAYYVLSRTKRYPPEALYRFCKKLVFLIEIVPVENRESLAAFSLCEDPSNAFEDYEDALQYICAKKVRASVMVTNDRDFVEFDIPIFRTSAMD